MKMRSFFKVPHVWTRWSLIQKFNRCLDKFQGKSIKHLFLNTNSIVCWRQCFPSLVFNKKTGWLNFWLFRWKFWLFRKELYPHFRYQNKNFVPLQPFEFVESWIWSRDVVAQLHPEMFEHQPKIYLTLTKNGTKFCHRSHQKINLRFLVGGPRLKCRFNSIFYYHFGIRLVDQIVCNFRNYECELLSWKRNL